MSDVPQAVLYPRYCFHLAPTANAWSFLSVKLLTQLKQYAGFEGEGFYFYKNLPIKWVRIVGVVVAIDDFANLRAYTIDDSSGACIEAIVTVSAPPEAPKDPSVAASTRGGPPVGLTGPPTTPYDHIDVGCAVDVKGALSEFRDEKQIRVEKMLVVKGTDDEVRLWEKRANFRRDVLDTGWKLDDRVIRRCRKEAERTAAEEEKRAKRLKAVTRGKTSTLSARNARRSETAAAVAVEKSAKGKRAARNERREMAKDVAELLANSDGKYSALGG